MIIKKYIYSLKKIINHWQIEYNKEIIRKNKNYRNFTIEYKIIIKRNFKNTPYKIHIIIIMMIITQTYFFGHFYYVAHNVDFDYLNNI